MLGLATGAIDIARHAGPGRGGGGGAHGGCGGAAASRSATSTLPPRSASAARRERWPRGGGRGCWCCSRSARRGSAAVAAGRRWRAADLGAGEELRNHELARRWIWEPRPARAPGSGVYLRVQGELVHERPWPAGLAVRVDDRPRRAGARGCRSGAGQHVMLVRRDRRRQDDHRPTADRRPHARAERARCWCSIRRATPRTSSRCDASPRRPGCRSSCLTPRTRRPIAGSRCGGRPTASPRERSSRSSSQSPTTTTCCAGTWTSSAKSFTPPTAGRRRCRSWSTPASRCATRSVRGDRRAARRRSTPGWPSAREQHGRYVSSRAGDQGSLRRRLPPRGRAGARQPTDGHPATHPRRGSRRRPAGRGAPAAGGGDVAHPRRHHARRGRRALRPRARRPPRRRRAGRRALDAAARRVRRGDQDGRRNAAVAILQRGRSHGGQVIVITQSAADIEALTGQTGLLASLTDNFAGDRRAPPDRPRKPRLARQADGHPRAVATHQPDHRPRQPTLRAGQRPPRPRVPDRRRRVQHPAPRRSRHLHARRRRTHASRHDRADHAHPARPANASTPTEQARLRRSRSTPRTPSPTRNPDDIQSPRLADDAADQAADDASPPDNAVTGTCRNCERPRSRGDGSGSARPVERRS